jgi:hypothetical protein
VSLNCERCLEDGVNSQEEHIIYTSHCLEVLPNYATNQYSIILSHNLHTIKHSQNLEHCFQINLNSHFNQQSQNGDHQSTTSQLLVSRSY